MQPGPMPKSTLHLRQLEALKAVCEHGSLTRAAQALDITQPAVSRLLSDLTSELGFRLLDRKDGRMVPTQEAKFLLPDIARVLEMMAQIAETGRDITQRKAGHLRVACLPGFAVSHMPSLVAEFLATHPGVTMTIEPDRPERILEWMLGEQYDCGITDDFAGHPAIEARTLDIRSVCIFPEGHRLEAKQAVRASDLGEEKMIHPRRDSAYFRALNEAFAEAGVALQSLVELRQFTGACELVRRGQGVSVVSELDARNYAGRGLSYRPFLPQLPHRLSLVRPVHQHPSMLTLEFLEAFEESLADLRC